jgi:hypothetical protein
MHEPSDTTTSTPSRTLLRILAVTFALTVLIWLTNSAHQRANPQVPAAQPDEPTAHGEASEAPGNPAGPTSPTYLPSSKVLVIDPEQLGNGQERTFLPSSKFGTLPKPEKPNGNGDTFLFSSKSAVPIEVSIPKAVPAKQPEQPQTTGKPLQWGQQPPPKAPGSKQQV